MTISADRFRSAHRWQWLSLRRSRAANLLTKQKLRLQENLYNILNEYCKDYLEDEQENETEIYFAEEILIEHAYQKTVKATDRATMMNLMAGLNGYTLCSSIYSEKLSGDQFLVIPFKDDDNIHSTMTIGYITKKNNVLSSMGRQFIDEVKRELAIRE